MRIVLRSQYKFLSVDCSSVLNGSEKPKLTKDGSIAWDLYMAGLACHIGKAVFHGETRDPLLTFFNDIDVEQHLADHKRARVPVYLGPSAMMLPDSMVVISSDARSSSYGLWTPRPDANFSPEQVNYVRIN